MASSSRVEQAKQRVWSQQWMWGDAGSRMHETGLAVGFTIYQALNHPCCGKCGHLQTKPIHIDGKDSVSLSCELRHLPKHDPIELWSDWLPGDLPKTCIDCTDPAGRPAETAPEAE